MSYKPVSVPALPVNVDPQLRQFLSAIKESLEVRLRQRGSALDASPTFKDLIDTGLLKIKDGVTTIGGKQYTAEQLLGLVEFSLPSWVTSDTAPPAPTGLVVTTDKTNTILRWTPSAFDQYASTEVWRATDNNLSVAEKIGSTSGYEFTDGLPEAGTVYYYWIRDVAFNTLAGPFNDVNGVGTALGPGTTVVTKTFVGPDVDLSWPTPTSNLAVALYTIEYYDGTWLPLDIVSGNSHRFRATWAGVRQFRLAAIDINGEQGPYTNFSVTVVVASAPEVAVQFNGEQVLLTWAVPSGSLPVDRYEVYDTTVSSATQLATLYATAFRTKVLWLNKNLLVRAIDTAGNAGTARSVPINITTPLVLDLTTEVIDNTVLLRWNSSAGSLPIRTYDLRRGPTWETATPIGLKDGGFTTVFEAPQSQTVYTYWLSAVDTATNYGAPASVTATVSQPPDYVLATNFLATYTGTRSNAAYDNSVLAMPLSTSQTWQSHFTSRGWATPQAQVSAGYPIFAQPGSTTGYYEEVFDYGATLAAMKIAVAFREVDVSGSVAVATTITTALDAGFTSGVQTFSGTQAFAVNFRYVKVRLTATATNDQGITQITDLSVKLDTKLKTQTGAVAVSAADVGGTTIYLTEDRTSTGTKTFLDVESITVSANTTSPVYAIYDFVDVYNPLSFKVLLYNSSGTRVSGTVSYSVRGY